MEQAKEKLGQYGQEHVLRYYEQLPEDQKRALLEQVERADLSILRNVGHRPARPGFAEPAQRGIITPLEVMTLSEIEENREALEREGLETIRQGAVGAVLLAGGMGTRLGSEEPKGTYPIGISRNLSIFECIFHNLLDVVRRASAWIHLFVMTSDKNHEETVRFLSQHGFFGYDRGHVHFFKQEMAVSTDYDGKIYMEEKWKMASSPNGNGGWYRSLKKSGLVKLVAAEGIEWFNVFAVDNVLQRIADPVFIGAVLRKGAAVGSKVVSKNAPDEKIGVMCLEDGKPSIIEYYELTEELMNAKDGQGEPAYRYGVILNYLFRRAGLEELEKSELPLHLVEKKIPYLDETGEKVRPERANGYKYENLVLDMIHQMDSCLPFEVARGREFAPVKNLTGADSVDTARALLLENGITL